MACDLIDFQCIFVNEIAGSLVIAALIGLILYFIVAGKLKFGFDTTIALLIPIVLIGSLMTTGFSLVYAVVTIVLVWMATWVFQEIIRNR